mmetsp:Transcript_15295/g.53765  ORF Transcript_15295/g.53765 Transcript_15295/m.53765 type:complete len:439 (-) Transcript_15295:270-1586(-)
MKVGVIGSGPIGLYAAHQLVKEGHSVTLFERASAVAGNVRSWGFVRLFSQLDLNVPTAVLATLEAQGCSVPALTEFITGDDFVAKVLEPLAEWLKASGKCELKLGCEVLGIGRGRFLKSDAIAATGDKRRIGKPFRVVFRDTASGKEAAEVGFQAMVDASGSYNAATGNRVGVGGLAAPGERDAEACGKLRRIIPDVKGADQQLVAGRRVAVIGTGYSAITCLRNLCDLAKQGGQGAPSEVFWLTRSPASKMPYSIMENDPLPQRSELAKFGNQFVNTSGNAENPWGSTKFEYVPAMAITAIEQESPDGCLRLALELGEDGDKERHIEVDALISLTGFHPDKEMWSEIQVHMCYASDGPMKLASSLLAAKLAMEGDPAAAGDCLSQAAPGPQTLLNPEPDFYVLGMKSYGRNSTFLMRVGYEQVDLLMEQLKQDGSSH